MSKLLIDENPLQVLPSLAKAIGLHEAIFLQQLHYWLSKSEHSFDGRVWVYNTAADWAEQLQFCCEKTIRRSIKSLKDQGLIETTSRFNKRKYDKTHWFTINYPAIEQFENQSEKKASGQSVQSVAKASGQSVQMEVDNLSRPIPETTREKPSSPKKQGTITRKPKGKNTSSDHAWLTAWFCFSYQQIEGRKYGYLKKDAGQINQLLKSLDLGDVVLRACTYFGMHPQKRFPVGLPTIGGLQRKINELPDPDDDLVDKFISAGLLPDLDRGQRLRDFQPWAEVKNDEQSVAAT